MPSLSQEDKELLSRLNRQPNLKKRIQAILSTAEDDGEGIVKADEAENRIKEKKHILKEARLRACLKIQSSISSDAVKSYS